MLATGDVRANEACAADDKKSFPKWLPGNRCQNVDIIVGDSVELVVRESLWPRIRVRGRQAARQQVKVDIAHDGNGDGNIKQHADRERGAGGFTRLSLPLSSMLPTATSAIQMIQETPRAPWRPFGGHVKPTNARRRDAALADI